jgi:hypothetical protein
VILKAVPKDIVTETIQKRYKDPIQVVLLIVMKYQPGSRKEKETLLQQFSCREVGWNEEKALNILKMWKWKIERAKELELIIPDPTVLLSGLDQITEKVIPKDLRRKFRVDSQRGNTGGHFNKLFENVEKYALVLKSELEDGQQSFQK